MNRPRAACLLAILLSMPAPARAQPLETLKAGVVKLYVQKADGLDDTGAGIVVGLAKGTVFILTAYHVVEDAESIRATFDSERWNSYEARLYQYDESMDIAVALVDFEAPDTPPAKLPTYQIRDADPQYNESVTAIGHPSDQLEWHPSAEDVALAVTEDPNSFLITRSQAERGFSGGPVFDAEGALMGIVVSVKTQQTKVVLSEAAVKKLKFWKVPHDYLVTGEAPEPFPAPDGEKPDVPDAGTGTIVVKTRPDVTRVRLDLREMGVTEKGSLTLENVEPGKYMLYVMQEGYISWREAVEVKAGREILVSARLEKKESGGSTSDNANIQAACGRLVQDKIAWNHTGTKRWSTANIERLCKGTRDATQPPRCFERAMHGGIHMGSGTRWSWQDAIDLCEGTDDAARTLSCFEAEIRRKYSQKDSIQKCSK